MKLNLVILSCVVAACGSSENGTPWSQAIPQSDTSAIPQSFDELSPEARNTFSSWKNQLIKGCRISEAFPSLMLDVSEKPADDPETKTLYVDARRLFEQTQGQALLSDSAGGIVALGTPLAHSGTGSQVLGRTRQLDGRTIRLELQSMLEGGDCVVTFNDQEVYRTTLFQRMPIAWAMTADQTSGMTPRAVEYTHNLNTSDRTAAVGLERLTTPIESMLTATSQAPLVATSLARRLAISEADAAHFFPFEPRLDLAALKASLPGAPAFLPKIDGARLYGAPEVIAPVFTNATASGELELNWLIEPPVIVAPGSVATGNHLWRIVTHHQLANEQEQAPGRWQANASVSKITVADAIPKADPDARSCFLRRAEVLRQFATGDVPRATDVGLPCKRLATSFVGALAKDGTARDALRAFTIQDPLSFSARRDYRGWDVLFTDVAAALARSPADLARLVVGDDSQGPPVDAMVRLDRMRAPLDADASFQQLYLAPLVRVTMTWMFKAVRVPDGLTDHVAATFMNTGAAYPESVAKMLNDLEVIDVVYEAGAGVGAAACGAGFVGESASVTAALFAKLRATASGRPWVASAEGSVLQRCRNQAELNALSQTADLVLAFIDEENARRPSGGSSFEDRLAETVTRAMDEAWSVAGFNAFRQIIDYAAESHMFAYCAPNRSLSSIAGCMGLDTLTTGVSGMLGADVAQRYSALADDLLRIDEQWLKTGSFNVRYRVEHAFFDQHAPLWNGCTADQFSLQKATLLQLLEEYRTAEGFNSKYDIEDRIEKVLLPCN